MSSSRSLSRSWQVADDLTGILENMVCLREALTSLLQNGDLYDPYLALNYLLSVNDDRTFQRLVIVSIHADAEPDPCSQVPKP